jgi:hypothetical protein
LPRMAIMAANRSELARFLEAFEGLQRLAVDLRLTVGQLKQEQLMILSRLERIPKLRKKVDTGRVPGERQDVDYNGPEGGKTD